jgi:hypothetical protein
MNKNRRAALAIMLAAALWTALAGCEKPKPSPFPRPTITTITVPQLSDCDYEDGNVDGTPCFFDGVYTDSSEYRNN